jgi:hypothetical protein
MHAVLIACTFLFGCFKPQANHERRALSPHRPAFFWIMSERSEIFFYLLAIVIVLLIILMLLLGFIGPRARFVS